jgi:hypothetical protein
VHDPNLFSWPEANPDAGPGDRCKAGHYVGTYSCTVKLNDAGLYDLNGPVDLSLAQAQSGEFLSVSGGTLKSTAAGLDLNATLVGQLSCQSGAFSGVLQNGQLSFLGFPSGTFGGTLKATFVTDGPKLDGTWTLTGAGPYAGYKCTGPWTATFQP